MRKIILVSSLLIALGVNAEPYITVEGGQANVDSSGLGVRIGVGYLAPIAKKFKFGGEASYSFLPSSNFVSGIYNVSTKYYAVDALANINYNIIENFSASLKGGVSYTHVEGSIMSNNSSAQTDNGEMSPTLIGSFIYNFPENIAITAGYRYTFGKEKITALDISSIPSISNVFIGLQYSFN